ncbi:MAG: tetratricopeptide repeat protein [Longimicrobiaceae bacterium]
MRLLIPTLLLLTAGCASLSSSPARPEPDVKGETGWRLAHAALREGAYDSALVLFERLHLTRPESLYGREALFFSAVILMDPRNPEWDPEAASTPLRGYLEREPDGPEPPRVREAETLLVFARQLTLPPEERLAALRPGERVVRVEDGETGAGASELRAQLARKDAEIRRLRQELERIKRTLVPEGR